MDAFPKHIQKKKLENLKNRFIEYTDILPKINNIFETKLINFIELVVNDVGNSKTWTNKIKFKNVVKKQFMICEKNYYTCSKENKCKFNMVNDYLIAFAGMEQERIMYYEWKKKFISKQIYMKLLWNISFLFLFLIL